MNKKINRMIPLVLKLTSAVILIIIVIKIVHDIILVKEHGFSAIFYFVEKNSAGAFNALVLLATGEIIDQLQRIKSSGNRENVKSE